MAVIAPLRVTDFKLRGGYPSLRALLASHEKRKDAGDGPGLSSGRLRGHFPPVAICRLRDEDAPLKLRLRDADLALLMGMRHDRGKRYLSQVLAAREGDERARCEVDSQSEAYLKGLREAFGAKRIQADRWVVPSMSAGDFPPEEVSHKGSILLKLSRQGYSVPDFVILTSQAYSDRESGLEKNLLRALVHLEAMTGRRLGSTTSPLVLAMRCAMPRYYPGLMPTYLNVGITDKALPALEEAYGRKAAYRMYLNDLRNLLACLEQNERFGPEEKEQLFARDEDLEQRVDELRRRIKKRDPLLLEDPVHQVLFLVRESYKRFENNEDLLETLSRGEKHVPALILQKMVCTVREDASYAGVLSSRNMFTGSGHHLETGHDLFGEDIMTGGVPTRQTAFRNIEDIREAYPGVHHFAQGLGELEREFMAPVTVEFAVEAARGHELFALLQLNETGMTGQAAFVAVVDMHKAGIITRKRLPELILPYHVKQVQSDTIAQESFETLDRFATGVALLPRSAVCAQLYFTAETALKAKQRGERVCFCKRSFVPSDAVVLREVDAILCLTSVAVHVASICQSFGTPALLSLESRGVRLTPDGLANSEGVVLGEGVWVTLSSRRQSVYKGRAQLKPARFMRYLNREKVHLSPEEEKDFAALAYAYRYYRQLVRAMELDQVSSLGELIRLVNLELRGEAEEARRFVHGWFDGHVDFYIDEVLKSDMGDHLNQHTVFDMLTPERKVRFYKGALARCLRERRSGYGAGTFMLGRFISRPQPVAFWESFSPREAAQLVNEWVLFEKYMQVLYDVGERKVARARRVILDEGLEDLRLAAGSVACLVPLKLSKHDLAGVSASLPAWADPQAKEVLGILRLPYSEFFDFEADWSLRKLKGYCDEAGIPVPAPEGV